VLANDTNDFRHSAAAKHAASFSCSLASVGRMPRTGVTTSCSVWPMSPPYPREWSKLGHSPPGLSFKPSAVRSYVNLLVVQLSWYHLGKVPRAPSSCALGVPLSSEQWATVRRLEAACEVWHRHPTVPISSLSRAQAKFESLECQLVRLNTLAGSLRLALDPYSNLHASDSKPFSPMISGDRRDSQTKVVGTLSNTVIEASREIDASRIKFWGSPCFNPSDVFDSETRVAYEDPSSLKTENLRGKPPHVRVRASRRHLIALLHKLDQSSRLALFPLELVFADLLNGLHAVFKDSDWDRLILDGRRPNFFERTLRKWIKFLGSTTVLQQMSLEDDQVLLLYLNDIRDYYYQFIVSENRAIRNALACRLSDEEARQFQAYPQDQASPDTHARTSGHSSQPQSWFPALATMAMGDTNSTEFGQCGHLAIGASVDAMRDDEMLTLYHPLPRGPLYTGAAVDDAAAVECERASKVVQNRFGRRYGLASSVAPASSTAGQRFARFEDGYLLHNLTAHPDKAQKRQPRGVLWGGQLDGEVGDLRPPTARAIALCEVTMSTVKLGYASVGLIECLNGCWVSTYMYGRRFLCSMDLCFEATKGRKQTDVLKLSRALKSEMISWVIFCPIVRIDLRLKPPGDLYLVDASKSKIATVKAEIPTSIGRELLRHVPLKGRWSRIMTPSQTWLYSHDMLPEEQHLPQSSYSSSSLWDSVALSQTYQVSSLKGVAFRDHINISECDAWGEAERLAAQSNPNSHVLLGTDSQVSLGSHVKGRAQSPSINHELCKQLPTIVGANLHSSGFYIRSKDNASDDPTRGVPVRDPVRSLPDWWSGAADGDFDALDVRLKSYYSQTLKSEGVPSLAELVPPDNPYFDIQWSHSWRQDRRDIPLSSSEISGMENGAFSLQKPGAELVVAPEVPDSRSTPVSSCSPALSSCAAPICHSVPSEHDHPLPSPVLISQQTLSSTLEATDVKLIDKNKAASIPTFFSKNVGIGMVPSDDYDIIWCRLEALGRSRFHINRKLCKPPSAPPHTTESSHWLPRQRGVLDLFSGSKRLTKALLRAGAPWVLTFDIKDGPEQNLLEEKLRRQLESLLTDQAFCFVSIAPVCSSMSIAVTPPVRCRGHPMGIPGLSPKWQGKIRQGNSFAKWSCQLLCLCSKLGVACVVENPTSSWMWRLRWWLRAAEATPFSDLIADWCRFGERWRKRTRFRTVHLFQPGFDYHILCTGGHEHLRLRGNAREHFETCKGTARTLLAQSYPFKFCAALAWTVSQTLKWDTEAGSHRNISSSAKVYRRIGEASNPGPPDRQDLDDVQLVERETTELQSRAIKNFMHWLLMNDCHIKFDVLLAAPKLLARLSRSYGLYLYRAKTSRSSFAMFLTALQRADRSVRQSLGEAWDLNTAWEWIIPVQHRPPVPTALFQAMTALALSLNWFRFAAANIVSFLGIARPSESQSAHREDMVLPCDTLQAHCNYTLVHVLNPKTRRRGARTQYIQVMGSEETDFLQALFQHAPSSTVLFPGTPHAFRVCWDKLLAILGIPKSLRFTPASNRSGGAVHAFQSGLSIDGLLWRMRITSHQTLSHYLQEVVATTSLRSLNDEAKANVSAFCKLYPVVLRLKASQLTSSPFWHRSLTSPVTGG